MGVIGRLQRRMTYVPVQPVPPVAAVLPGAEEVTVRTDDGLDLAAWWHPVPDPPAPAVLVLHGNGGNRAGRASLASGLAERGLSTLLLDYRGYGGNPGRPHEDGLSRDAAAARAWLGQRADVGPVIILGESLGAAVAAREAARCTPAAIVLRSPFTSLAAVARHHWPLLPARAITEEYPTAALVADSAAPLLVVLGDADSIVPPAQSREVYEAGPEPKRLVVVEDAGHNHAELAVGRPLLDAVGTHAATHLPTETTEESPCAS